MLILLPGLIGVVVRVALVLPLLFVLLLFEADDETSRTTGGCCCCWFMFLAFCNFALALEFIMVVVMGSLKEVEGDEEGALTTTDCLLLLLLLLCMLAFLDAVSVFGWTLLKLVLATGLAEFCWKSAVSRDMQSSSNICSQLSRPSRFSKSLSSNSSSSLM